MSVVNAGSNIEVVIGGSDSIVAPISNPMGTPLQDRVSAVVNVIPSFTVTSFQIANSQPLSQVLGDTYAYVATLEIVTNTSIDSADVLSALVNAFNTATGYYPTESAVTKVNNASTGVVAATPPSSALDSVSSAFSGLNTLVKSVPPLVIGAIVIGIGLIVFIVVKNPPKLKAR